MTEKKDERKSNERIERHGYHLIGRFKALILIYHLVDNYHATNSRRHACLPSLEHILSATETDNDTLALVHGHPDRLREDSLDLGLGFCRQWNTHVDLPI
jgi:hypothetical protein